MKKPVICWMRRDIRLHDHRALHEAIKSDQPVVMLFVFDEKILAPLRNPDDVSTDIRLSFIIEALAELEDKLAKHGSSLKVLHGDPGQLIPAYASEINAHALYTNEDYEPYAKVRDQRVKEELALKGIEFFSYKDHVIMGPDQILKDDETIYKVFSAYKRKWIEAFLGQGSTLSHYQCTLKNHLVSASSEKNFSSTWHQKLGFKETPPILKASSKAAHDRLTYFQKEILSSYHETRDFPDRDGTSMISVYIRHGLLSIRELFSCAQTIPGEGGECWRSELIWREFYQMLLAKKPDLISRAFRPEYDNIEWIGGRTEFEKWCQGMTGFPIVDAAMRCLNQTGLMPNRLRMVCASFLCKTLLVNWRLGEEYFARKLLDFDLAANNGGWQWSASCGVDAQPYFRIFNPYAQSEKFDPNGEFIKRWCPELALIDGPAIHNPEKLSPLEQEIYGCRTTLEYPAPIVDYKAKRDEALSMYKKALKPGARA